MEFFLARIKEISSSISIVQFLFFCYCSAFKLLPFSFPLGCGTEYVLSFEPYVSHKLLLMCLLNFMKVKILFDIGCYVKL